MRRGQMIVLVMSLGAHIVVLGALMVQRHALSLVPATPVMEVLIAPPFQRRPVAGKAHQRLPSQPAAMAVMPSRANSAVTSALRPT